MPRSVWFSFYWTKRNKCDILLEKGWNSAMENNYRKIQLDCGLSIDEMVEILNGYQNRKEKVCVEFNGTIFYSDTVTIDNAYVVLTGMSKAEFDEFKDAEEKKIMDSMSDADHPFHMLLN